MTIRRAKAACLAAAIRAGSAGPGIAACEDPDGVPAWLQQFKAEAAAQGVSPAAIAALDGVRFDQSVVDADRRQGVFSQSFLEFSDRMVAQYRMDQGRNLLKKYAETFDRIEREFGVPGPVIVAFWGLETDFGANLGDKRTLQSLATLAYDCRRPDLFRAELLAALQLLDRGDLAAEDMVGAWAGDRRLLGPGDGFRRQSRRQAHAAVARHPRL